MLYSIRTKNNYKSFASPFDPRVGLDLLGRSGLFGGDNGWGSVVTSLVPLGTAFAIYRRWSNRGAIKELNSFPGIEGFDQPVVTTVIYLGWRFKFKYGLSRLWPSIYITKNFNEPPTHPQDK